MSVAHRTFSREIAMRGAVDSLVHPQATEDGCARPDTETAGILA